jgi:hypothetical protein
MATNTKTVELGDLVKDRISGFQGVAVCFTVWINGCVRWTLQPESKTKECAPGANETFDVQQLEVVRKLKIEPPQALPARAPVSSAAAPGGPRPGPKRNADPTRRTR